MGKKASRGDQMPLDGVATETEINKPSTLESKNLKAIGKEVSKAKLACIASIDSIRDKIADGCAAPESCEKAVKCLEKAVEDILNAQTAVRGSAEE